MGDRGESDQAKENKDLHRGGESVAKAQHFQATLLFYSNSYQIYLEILEIN